MVSTMAVTSHNDVIYVPPNSHIVLPAIYQFMASPLEANLLYETLVQRRAHLARGAFCTSVFQISSKAHKKKNRENITTNHLSPQTRRQCTVAVRI